MKKRFLIKDLNCKVNTVLLISILSWVGCVYSIDNVPAIFTGFSLIPWSQCFVPGLGFGEYFAGEIDKNKGIQRCINRTRFSPDVIHKIKTARSDTIPLSTCKDISLEEYNHYICSRYDVKKEDYPFWYRDMEKRYKSKRKSQRQNCQQKIMAKNERIKLLKRNLSEQKEKLKNKEKRYNETLEEKDKEIQSLENSLQKTKPIYEECLSTLYKLETEYEKLQRSIDPRGRDYLHHPVKSFGSPIKSKSKGL